MARPPARSGRGLGRAGVTCSPPRVGARGRGPVGGKGPGRGWGSAGLRGAARGGPRARCTEEPVALGGEGSSRAGGSRAGPLQLGDFKMMTRSKSSMLAQGAPSVQVGSGQGSRPRGRPPRKLRKRKVSVTTELTLFEMVALGKNSMQTAVEEWVQSYKEDRALALLDLISFFMQCCGCEGMVTAELCQSSQGGSAAHTVTERFDQETGLYYKKFVASPWILTVMWPEKPENDFYPIVGPGPFWKRFRANFCEFTELLVRQMHCSALCDGQLVDTVICMLTGLTTSAVHSLRHTSSLAAMKLLTALASVNQGTCPAQRLYDIKRVSRLKRRREACGQLLGQRQQPQHKPEAIDNIICSLFKRTFVPRYRDVSSDIRVICVAELGCWIRLYPDMFLDNNYLKYIGWMLYDKDASVRLKCITALKVLYEKRESAMKLGLFFHRFKKRILSMTQDRQPEITSECMQLLGLISEHYEGVFSNKEYIFLFQFVYAAYRPLATAAGQLVCKSLSVFPRLLALPPQESFLSLELPDKFNRNFQSMKTLIDFYLQGEVGLQWDLVPGEQLSFHRHVPYLVDGLWDSAPSLVQNWECMTALLLEPRGGRRALTTQQERVLIEILVAAVRQVAEGHPPTGRRLGKRASRELDKARRWCDHADMSQHFVKVLPQLLSKFAADKEKVTHLLQIPQYCNLHMYGTDGLDPHLDAALLELDCLVQRHSDVAVLEACAQAYGSYCDEGGPAHCQAVPACSRLVDMLVDMLTPLLDTFMQQEKQGLFPRHGEVVRICSTLRRLAAFYSAHDLSGWNLYEKVDCLLTFRRQQGSLPTEVVHCALQCTYYALLWQIVAATDQLPPQEVLLGLRSRLMKFCLVCRAYLGHESKVLSERAFILLCDLLLILSHQGPEEHTGLGLLFFVPNHVLQGKLIAFVREHVFLEEAGPPGSSRVCKDDTDKLDNLFRRRNMLAVFCKLIVYNVLEMNAAAEVYQFYLKHYHHFGDIIKETITRTRQNDRLRNALSLLLCLQQLFQKHADTCGLGFSPVEFICGPLASIRLLARRLALTLGFDRARDTAHLIHRRGLAFAFSEAPELEQGRLRFPNLGFLLLLAEFSCKIPQAERGAALAHFRDSIPEGLPIFGEGDVDPLVVYRKSLMRTYDVFPGEEEPAANPFDAICKHIKCPQELPTGSCSAWTPDTLASSTGTDTELTNRSRGGKSKRDIFDADFLSDSESSDEDIDVEHVPPPEGVSD
ncbi:cohesin subunit SA-2-like [Manis pentadactyla]|uniref:cohesin subunit SA-2-like n=1 Tax=Manis pentadactyla TaxID=143292 RepID=UPI00255D0BD6|nr:cohesin subunit SA-2-like [Manis pentadactyla]XP_057352237.1 cohesin subunit SA-2-like [Manis pentadactyla]